MSFYLDASVVVPLFVQQASSETIEAWICGATVPLIVSDLAASEFASAISRFVRKGELAANFATARHDAFEEWRRDAVNPVENLPADIRHAANLVRNPLPRLLTPDAIHLATCRRLGVTLATLDRDLQTICERENVACIAPG